ncbi:MAG: hypothetical protein A2096_14920 [Spirochaetes bacterium GWF1_41_5]|nr:MAG: hypothetical protein A2096_14920 [Spirochaetes bacterium GWF1_41_5]
MSTEAIEKRYSSLAQSTCCLSCGGAIDRAQVKKGDICLDLGSGRGTDAVRLAEKTGSQGFVYGVDVSSGMIEKARELKEKTGTTNVEFIQSALEKIPLPGSSIDLVISNCTINHAEDKNMVWSEIFRVLKPGGSFVISDIYALGEVPEIYRNDPLLVAECWAGSDTKTVYLERLNICGFTGITIIEESEPYDKGKIKTVSFTICGRRPEKCCYPDQQ